MITSSGSGNTIKHEDKIVNQEINDLRNAIQELECSFAKNIEGDNKLEWSRHLMKLNSNMMNYSLSIFAIKLVQYNER